MCKSRLPGVLFAPLLVFALATASAAAATQTQTPPGITVASAHPAATAAGIQIMQQGGNAFDAAVAVSAVLAVVEPQSSGLGGGGFWLLHRAADGHNVMIDGRERAPLAAGPDMYLDDSGKYVSSKSKDGGLAAGIPGEPAALAYIAKHYGKLGLAKDLAPAIDLARHGMKVSKRMHKLIAWRADVVSQFPAAAAIFLTDKGAALPAGTLLKRPDLAATLTAMAKHGRAGFYTGDVAQMLVDGARAAGGIWTLEDLADYQVKLREPVTFTYRDLKIVSAAPPSSGGIVLQETFNILANFHWDDLSSAQHKHIVAEALRRAYRDRAAFLGDPDFVAMPLKRLTSHFYAAGLRAGIRLDRATPSSALAPPDAVFDDGHNTSHFSIIDSHGNRVAATLSINLPLGSGVVPPGTGVVLNDEMDDFSAKPMTPNAYGLLGTHANAIAPGKRPLSSMSPTFVIGPQRTAVMGTPGGSRIISMVLLGILDFQRGSSAEHIVGLPRYHQQYMPDYILYEPGALRAPEKQALKDMGHTLKLSTREYGDMQVVIWDRATDSLEAASDPRGVGAATVAVPKGTQTQQAEQQVQ